MVAPGSYEGKKIGLFATASPTSRPSASWIAQVQETATEWDESESGLVIEQVDLPSGWDEETSITDFALQQLAHHVRSTFSPPQSPFLSRSFLVADKDSVSTNSLIVVSLTLAFARGEEGAQGQVLDGWLRVHPSHAIQLPSMFDVDVQGVELYIQAVLGRSDGILPSAEEMETGKPETAQEGQEAVKMMGESQ